MGKTILFLIQRHKTIFIYSASCSTLVNAKAFDSNRDNFKKHDFVGDKSALSWVDKFRQSYFYSI